jgi:hypothetical protein
MLTSSLCYVRTRFPTLLTRALENPNCSCRPLGMQLGVDLSEASIRRSWADEGARHERKSSA